MNQENEPVKETEIIFEERRPGVRSCNQTFPKR